MRQEVVTGAVKVFYADVFRAAIEKRPHNSLNIAGHFQACAGPVFCHEGRGPVAPATGTALDIGDDQDALKPSVQYLVPSMRILARLFSNLVCFRIFYLTAEIAETAEGTRFINIYYFSAFSAHSAVRSLYVIVIIKLYP